MNERGFFTVIGICFLLVAAILVKGVQESERNYIDITRNFKDETDLQNIADSALIEAMDIIKSGYFIPMESSLSVINRSYNQNPIPLQKNYDADVKVFYEYGKISNGGNIRLMNREYKSGSPYNDKIVNNDQKGVILISVASREVDGVTIYRRALGYFLTDGDEENPDKEGKPKNYIYFMNHLSND